MKFRFRKETSLAIGFLFVFLVFSCGTAVDGVPTTADDGTLTISISGCDDANAHEFFIVLFDENDDVVAGCLSVVADGAATGTPVHTAPPHDTFICVGGETYRYTMYLDMDNTRSPSSGDYMGPDVHFTADGDLAVAYTRADFYEY